MRILVLGGTGAMGIHVVDLLAQKGNDVYVTSRRTNSSEGNISYLKGDAKNLDFLTSLLNDKWGAIIDFMVYSTDEFGERYRLFLNATPHYLYFSSSRVYANSEKPITEESARLLDVCTDNEYLQTDEYALSKARQEDILRASGKANFTIIRPYITYSENRFQLGVLEKEEWLYRALKGKKIVFDMELMEKKTTLTYALDVANGIVSLLEAKPIGDTFHITAPAAIRWKEVLVIYLEILSQHLGYTPKVVLVDQHKFFKLKGSTYQIKYDRMFDREFNSNKISEYIDTKSFLGVREGIRLSLSQFLQNPEFNNINLMAEVRKDVYAKDLTNIFEIKGLKNKLRAILIWLGLK